MRASCYYIVYLARFGVLAFTIELKEKKIEKEKKIGPHNVIVQKVEEEERWLELGKKMGRKKILLNC